MFPESKTELEYASTEDAPEMAKLLTKVVRLMLTFESLKRILPPTSDAASPANSEAMIVLPITLLRPPKRLIAAPEKAEFSQNLVLVTDKTEFSDASK